MGNKCSSNYSRLRNSYTGIALREFNTTTVHEGLAEDTDNVQNMKIRNKKVKIRKMNECDYKMIELLEANLVPVDYIQILESMLKSILEEIPNYFTMNYEQHKSLQKLNGSIHPKYWIGKLAFLNQASTEDFNLIDFSGSNEDIDTHTKIKTTQNKSGGHPFTASGENEPQNKKDKSYNTNGIDSTINFSINQEGLNVQSSHISTLPSSSPTPLPSENQTAPTLASNTENIIKLEQNQANISSNNDSEKQKVGSGEDKTTEKRTKKSNKNKNKKINPKKLDNFPDINQFDNDSQKLLKDIYTKQKIKLEERLSLLNFRSINIRKDGNSFFRAVSWNLYGSEAHHRDIRNYIVNFMSKNSAGFLQFFKPNSDDFGNYIKQISICGNWADELCVQATANCCNCTIHILTAISEDWYLRCDPIILPGRNVTKPQLHLFISYLAPSHYDVFYHDFGEETN